jgi:predicted dehydrogenase
MVGRRIAVIGLGQRIAHVLAAMDEVGWAIDLAGYADPAPVGLTILAEAGIRPGRPYADEADLLADGPFDLIMIGSPNHLHLDHLKAALRAGCPVFSEKPIVRTIEESFELAALLAHGATPPLFIGLVMRSMPLVREVIARVDAGELGDLVSLDATEHLHPEHGAYLARNWRRKGAWGGSFMLDKVCHDFDIFGRLAGSRAASVASFGGRRIFTPKRAAEPQAYEDGSPAYALRDAGWMGANDPFHSDMDLFDHQVALARYESGLVLSFHSNSHVSLQERRWYLAGTRGTLLADLVRNRLMIRPALDRRKPERIDFATRTADLHNGADQAMALDLLAALDGERPFPVTPKDSLDAGLTVMAIDEAAARGETIDLAPLWARLDAASAGSLETQRREDAKTQSARSNGADEPANAALD